MGEPDVYAVSGRLSRRPYEWMGKLFSFAGWMDAFPGVPTNGWEKPSLICRMDGRLSRRPYERMGKTFHCRMDGAVYMVFLDSLEISHLSASLRTGFALRSRNDKEHLEQKREVVTKDFGDNLEPFPLAA